VTEYAASAGAHSSSQIPKGAVSLPQGMVRRMSILHLWWQRNQRALSGTDSSTGGEVVVTEYAASAGAHSSSQLPKGAVLLPQGMVRRMRVLHLWRQRDQRAFSVIDSSTGGEAVITEHAASAGAHSSGQLSKGAVPLPQGLGCCQVQP